MRAFPRPVVVISKCLEFEACRYDGEVIPFPWMNRLKPHVRFVPVCPEVEIGLGIPRGPIRIVSAGNRKRLVQPSAGKDLSAEMRKFAKDFRVSLGEEADGFILKSRSPSCAVDDAKVFPGAKADSHVGRGAGLFAENILRRRSGTAIADETRLGDTRYREHFFTHLFARADFRGTKRRAERGALARFHAENEFLLMAYSKKRFRDLGKIFSGMDGGPFRKSLLRYERIFRDMLARPPRRPSVFAVLKRCLEHLPESVDGAGKSALRGAMERYRRGGSSLGAVTRQMRKCLRRSGNSALRNQTFIEPFPGDLSDGGRPAPA
ncbi:MAG: DUF523 and DUF1722 domain-containing protein, partial [Nitrospinota bacterium]|nr:DUF523 and DUF1722 domain-containing protein [Nitrospinota bacterium]